MTDQTPPDPRAVRSRRPALRVAVAGLAAVALLALAPLPAGSQEASPPPALGAVLDGEVDGLTATALSSFVAPEVGAEGQPDMEVVISVTNGSASPRPVAVPFGTLLATDNEADQIVAVGGPTGQEGLAEVAASGGTPAVDAPPGSSEFRLTVYCTEHDDTAPMTPTPMRYAGMAGEPLPTVLRNIAAQQPSWEVAQDAVWWVTDDPAMPVPDRLASLLDGVDVEAFAADPEPVIPDSDYEPRWARAGIVDESFDSDQPARSPLSGDTGSGGLLWLLMITAAAIVTVLVAMRLGRRERPVAAPVRHDPGPAGWYADPWSNGGHRWWNGRAWTDQVMKG